MIGLRGSLEDLAVRIHHESHDQRVECRGDMALGHAGGRGVWYLSRAVRWDLSDVQISR